MEKFSYIEQWSRLSREVIFRYQCLHLLTNERNDDALKATIYKCKIMISEWTIKRKTSKIQFNAINMKTFLMFFTSNNEENEQFQNFGAASLQNLKDIFLLLLLVNRTDKQLRWVRVLWREIYKRKHIRPGNISDWLLISW